jgi:hypothetical protein
MSTGSFLDGKKDHAITARSFFLTHHRCSLRPQRKAKQRDAETLFANNVVVEPRRQLNIFLLILPVIPSADNDGQAGQSCPQQKN